MGGIWDRLHDGVGDTPCHVEDRAVDVAAEITFIVIALIICSLCAYVLLKPPPKPPMSSQRRERRRFGEKVKNIFLTCLLLSNAFRVLSLVLQLCLKKDAEGERILGVWWNCLFGLLVPLSMFFCTHSVIIAFWTQVLTKWRYVKIAFGIVCVTAITSWLGLLIHYSIVDNCAGRFVRYSMFSYSIFNLLGMIGSLVCGIGLYRTINSLNVGAARIITTRMVIFCVFCFIAFLFRTIYGFLLSSTIPVENHDMWMSEAPIAISLLLAEWIPSLVFLITIASRPQSEMAQASNAGYQALSENDSFT